MALIVYNKENSRPQQVVYQGKRTINMDSKGTVYLSKTMSIELGILGGGRVNFAHDEDTERKTVQFMIAKAPIEVGGTVYYKILLSNPIFK